MAYCGVGPLFAAKFKKFKWLKPHKSVNNNKKLKITPIYSSNIPSFNVCFSKYCRLCCRFPCSFNCCSLQDLLNFFNRYGINWMIPGESSILMSRRFRICMAKGGRESLRPSYGQPKLTLIARKKHKRFPEYI